MHKLLDFVCDELEGLERKAEKDKLTMTDVQYGDTLAHLKKNLLTAEAMMESDYSNDNSYARGRGGNARRDSMGRYSRNTSYDNMSGNRDYYSNRGYSMDENEFRMELKSLINDAPNEHVRQKMKSLMAEI